MLKNLNAGEPFPGRREDFESDENQDVLLPGSILPGIGKDDDIRVRFSAAISCARLFSTPYMESKNMEEVYQIILLLNVELTGVIIVRHS